MRGFYNRRFYNRRFCDRRLFGQERLDLEFLVYVQLFLPLRFAIFFYSKIFFIETTHEAQI